MINKSITMKQLVTDFRELECRVREMDFSKLSEIDVQILSDYAEMKQFFSDIGNSLDYVVASTPFSSGVEKDTLSSLMERERCIRTLRNLTNDNDKEFIYFIYSERYQAEYTSEERREREQLAVCRSKDIYEKVYRYEPYVIAHAITVSSVALTVNSVYQEMDKYCIDRSDIYESTMGKVVECYEKGQLNVLYEEEKGEVFKQNEIEDVVVVESSDGYAVPTSANLDNPVVAAKFFEKVQNGNEIVNTASPRETTIDASRVGGNVKYEEADDIGTIEKGDGVPSYEEKEAMTEEQDNVLKKDIHEAYISTREERDSPTRERKYEYEEERELEAMEKQSRKRCGYERDL